MKENVRKRVFLSGCEGEENGYNTQLLYFTCSPLTRDDRYLFLITDMGGSPNVMVRDLLTETPFPSEEAVRELDAAFIRQDLSPGGCADLLAVTLFLDSLEAAGKPSLPG